MSYVFLCDIGDKIVPIGGVLRLVALGADKLPDILVFDYVVSNVIANAAVSLGVKIEQCFHFGLAQLQSGVKPTQYLGTGVAFLFIFDKT